MTDKAIENELIDAYTKMMKKICDLDNCPEKYSLISIVADLDVAMNSGVEYLSKF